MSSNQDNQIEVIDDMVAAISKSLDKKGYKIATSIQYTTIDSKTGVGQLNFAFKKKYARTLKSKKRAKK